MPKPTMPQAGDLRAYIRSLHVLNEKREEEYLDGLGLEVKAASAVRRFEEDTGLLPYLASGSDGSYYFDPPGHNRQGLYRGGDNRLSLGGGFYTVTSVARGVTLTDTTGTVLTLHQDYYLLDTLNTYDGPSVNGYPWEYIVFPSRIYGAPRSIKVVGRKGCVGEVPDMVWDAVLKLGAYLCVPELALQRSNGVVEVRDQSTEVVFGEGGKAPIYKVGELWLREYKAVVANYKRI